MKEASRKRSFRKKLSPSSAQPSMSTGLPRWGAPRVKSSRARCSSSTWMTAYWWRERRAYTRHLGRLEYSAGVKQPLRTTIAALAYQSPRNCSERDERATAAFLPGKSYPAAGAYQLAFGVDCHNRRPGRCRARQQAYLTQSSSPVSEVHRPATRTAQSSGRDSSSFEKPKLWVAGPLRGLILPNRTWDWPYTQRLSGRVTMLIPHVLQSCTSSARF